LGLCVTCRSSLAQARHVAEQLAARPENLIAGAGRKIALLAPDVTIPFGGLSVGNRWMPISRA
jgi:hypothetical protein